MFLLLDTVIVTRQATENHETVNSNLLIRSIHVDNCNYEDILITNISEATLKFALMSDLLCMISTKTKK